MIFDGSSWAVYTILGKKLLEKNNPVSLTVYAFLFGSILLIPFAFYEGLANPLSFDSVTKLLLASRRGSFKYSEFLRKDGMFPMTSLKGKETGKV